MKTLLSIFIVLFFVPSGVYAKETDGLAVSWVSPVDTVQYEYDKDIHVSVIWQLPPDWSGNIYVYLDGKQVNEYNTGRKYIAVNNRGANATSTDVFDFDLGAIKENLPILCEGREIKGHCVELMFWGGKTCAINALAHKGGATCIVTKDNFIPHRHYESRFFSITKPTFAKIAVRGAENIFMQGESATIQIENIGEATLSGVVSASSPFRCRVGCSYTLHEGESAVVTLEHIAGERDVAGDVSFSCLDGGHVCVGTPLPIFRRLSTKSSEILKPIQSESTTTLPDALYANVGDCVYGAFMTPSVPSVTVDTRPTIVGSSAFTCVSGCDARVGLPITLKFCPVDASTVSTRLMFSSGGSTSTLLINGKGGATPDGVFSTKTLSFNPTPLTEASYLHANLINIGIGILKGTIGDMSLEFSCVYNCSYELLAGKAHSQNVIFRFTPKVRGAREYILSLPNISPMTLSGEGR